MFIYVFSYGTFVIMFLSSTLMCSPKKKEYIKMFPLTIPR